MFFKSLYSPSIFFASSFKLLKQGFLLPKPPQCSKNQQSALRDLLKSKGTAYTKADITNPEFAPEDRKESQVLAEKNQKELALKKAEHQKNFDFPKRALTVFAIYTKMSAHKFAGIQFKDRQAQIASEFKKISESERAELEKLSQLDKERYSREVKEYEIRNAKFKIPPLTSTNGFRQFQQELSSSEKPVKAQEAAGLWKQLTQDQRDDYIARAKLINTSRKDQQKDFEQLHNLSEEDQALYKKKSRKSVVAQDS